MERKNCTAHISIKEKQETVSLAKKIELNETKTVNLLFRLGLKEARKMHPSELRTLSTVLQYEADLVEKE